MHTFRIKSLILALTISIYGCSEYDLPINASLNIPSYTANLYEAFECTRDGIVSICRFEADYFNCNPTDFLTYTFNDYTELDANGDVISVAPRLVTSVETGGAIPCTTETFPRADAVEDFRPALNKPQ